MTILPGPNEVLGEPKVKSKIPPPNEVLSNTDKGFDLDSVMNTPEMRANDSVDKFIEELPDVLPGGDTQKKILKDLALKGTPLSELKNAFLTMAGRHPHQESSTFNVNANYYYNDKGLPVPLKSNERPPQGFDVANDLHSTQEEANKKGFFASAGGHIYNGIVKGVLGLEGLANLPYALVTGEDADWYASARNRTESSLYKSPEYESENQLFDAKDVKGVEDFFDSKRYNLDANTLQGAALNGLESVTSFLVGTKGLGAVGKIAGATAEGAGLINEGGKIAQLASGASKAGAITHAYGASYAITMPEVLDYMEQNGITGTEKYRLASLISVVVAGTELLGGVEGQFAKNAAAKGAKSEMLKGLVDGAKRTMNPDGTMSKEALGNLYKATTIEANKLKKSFARDVAQNIGEEAGTEALQDLEKQGLAEIYDHISGEDNFKKDPISFEAFGEYYNAALNGAAGAGGMSTAATIQKRRQEVDKNQSNNVFNTVQKGPEAITALKMNIKKAVNDGEITAEQGAQADLRVDSYNEYNEQLKKYWNLKEEDKRRVFDLTFEKQNLESQIPTDYEAEKLNGIAQAEVGIKKKQAKHIQDEIEKIFLKHDVENTTTPTAKKTEEEVAKEIEKDKEAGNTTSKDAKDISTEEYKKLPKYEQMEYRRAKEKRTYDEYPKQEYNKPTTDFAVKQKLLADKIESSGGVIYGTTKLDNTTFEEGNRTFKFELPDGKSNRFASSKKTSVEKTEESNVTGGISSNTYEENFDNPENPVDQELGATVVKLDGRGRKVIFLWNANKSSPKYGKHIGMIKESKKGDSGYNEIEIEQMDHLRTTNMAPKDGGTEIVTEKKPTPTYPIAGADIRYSVPKVVLGQPTRENIRNKHIEDKIQELKDRKEYHPDFDKFYRKSLGEKWDEANPTLYKTEIAEDESEKELATDGLATEDNPQFEPVIKTLESKAESSDKAELKEVVVTSTYLIDGATGVVNMPIDKLSVDESRFQNRDELDKDVVKQIAENFDENQFDPIVVWKDGDEIFVLAGHHRLEGAKLAGQESVKVRFFKGDEAQAIEYAREKSNANRTMENPVERAKIYREKLARGESKKSVEEQAKQNEGKNASFYLNIAALNPEGIAIETYNRFKQSEDKATQKEVDKILDWIGDVRRAYPELTDQHEQELFKFLFDKEASKRVSTKSDFRSKVSSIVSTIDFDAEKPLNIARFKYKTEGEGLYDTEVADLKSEINDRQNQITDLKDRFSNPTNAKYVAPSNAEYDSMKKLADEKIASLSSEQKILQEKLQELYRNKGKYTDAGSDQGELFQKKSSKEGNKKGIEKIVEVLQKAMPKMKVIYNENMTVAGYVYKDHVFINPRAGMAGLDTPIHEYAHVLIDSLGYNSEIVQEGIKQLKDTDLWKEIEARYKEENLTEEQLGKEVLAEAIGREGADIFEDVSKESKFKKWLDKLFTWFKEKLGLEKNVAKKLAKQLLRGEGTQEMTGTSTEVQKQKVKESSAEEIKEMPLTDLVNQYWEYVNSGVKGKKFDELKKQLGYKLFQTRKQELLDSPNAEKFIEKLANTEDIGKADVLFKTLSHMSENFPELQKFSKEFENANFDMVQESNKLKTEAEKLAKTVIDEKNKSLGLKDKVKNLFSSDNTKYFEYLENPKAIEETDEDTGETIYSSGYWTEAEAKKKGFSDAQIKFLNFMRKLQEMRNEQYLESGNTGEIDGVLKVDKGFKEALKTGDLTEAFSAYLGNTAAIKDTELKFTDPVSGKVGLETYESIERKLIAYGKKGILSKLNAMRLMLKYNFQARRRSKEKFGQFSISPSGTLNNKFLKSRDKQRGYSKDFYKAALTFIDDYTHSKHIGKLLPYIDSIEAINQSGYLEHASKPQTVEYIKKWKDLHLFKNDKQGALGPEVDAGFRLLRKVTSLATMAFNVPAAFWNTGTGIYNNIRQEGAKAQGIGLKRLLEGTNRAKFKAYNKKANDIINKYQVVSSDYDSNPKLFAGKIFDMLANGLNREAEYLIQGSMFLGQLSEADYNNLQYNSEGELEYVGKDQKEFKEKVIKYKNRVSDIQGKYADKDRRNYNLTEFGKSAAQFKNWLPDAIKERFGAQYINSDGELKAGTWNSMLGEGLQDLRKQINKKGLAKAIWEDKASMSNLKGALTVAVLLSLKFGDDDDKKKRGAVDTLDKALGNVLMIFDPQSLKFTVSNPVASIGTLNRFIDAFEHVIEIDNGIKFNFERAGKDIGKALPYRKLASETYDLLTEE